MRYNLLVLDLNPKGTVRADDRRALSYALIYYLHGSIINNKEVGKISYLILILGNHIIIIFNGLVLTYLRILNGNVEIFKTNFRLLPDEEIASKNMGEK